MTTFERGTLIGRIRGVERICKSYSKAKLISLTARKDWHLNLSSAATYGWSNGKDIGSEGEAIARL